MHTLPIRYGKGTVHSEVNKVSLCPQGVPF